MSEHPARPATQPSATWTIDEIVQHSFPTVRKGLDEGQVRSFLRRVAGDLESARRREDDLHQRVAELEQRWTAGPELTPELLLQHLGEETARVLRSAQEAAEDIRHRAEEHAAALVRDAHEEARTVRDETRTLVDDRTAEAQAAAETIEQEAQTRAREVRTAADAYAATTREEAERDAAARTAAALAAAGEAIAEAESQARQARSDADAYATTTRRTADETAAERLADATRRATAEVEGARSRGREMVAEAQAVRERMLGDLARRKSVAQARVDELRAGRDRLLEAYSVVRRTLEEATNALTHAEGPSERRPTPATADPADAELTASEAIEATGSNGSAGETIVGGIVFDVEVTRPLGSTPAGSIDDDPDDLAVAAEVELAEEPVDDEPAVEEPVAETEPEEPVAEEPIAEPVVEEPVAEELVAETEPEPEPELVAAPEADDRVVVLESGDPIDALFERLKTKRRHAPNGGNGRASTNPRHDGVPANGYAAGGREPAPAPTPVAVIDLPAAESPAGASRAHDETADVAIDRRGRDLALLTRRDEQVRPLVIALTRKVKRALQDEQNELLSGLRRSKKGVDLTVLPGLTDRVAAVAAAAAPALADAHAAGAGRAEPGGDDRAAADALADGLAGELLVPLRERLVAGLAPGGTLVADASEAAERVSAQYREWKTERVEGAVHDALHAAWVRGAYSVAPQGRTLRWVLDPLGTCPDCEDNALEPTPKGGSFPTGHAHPPAHPGCRCMIAAE